MIDRFDGTSFSSLQPALPERSSGREQPTDSSETLANSETQAPALLGSKPTGWTPVFTGVLLFVGAVSFYDGYLVVRTGDMIEDFEKNPVGRYLIKIDNGSPDVFLRVKAAGTILALTALSLLHRRSSRLASPIAFALFAFQTGLLIFLEGPFS
jgi:hypothetical protein